MSFFENEFIKKTLEFFVFVFECYSNITRFSITLVTTIMVGYKVNHDDYSEPGLNVLIGSWYLFGGTNLFIYLCGKLRLTNHRNMVSNIRQASCIAKAIMFLGVMIVFVQIYNIIQELRSITAYILLASSVYTLWSIYVFGMQPKQERILLDEVASDSPDVV